MVGHGVRGACRTRPRLPRPSGRVSGAWPRRRPLFCDLLANQHLHLEHEVDVERVAEVKQISNVAVMSIAESIERTLPEIGRKGSLDILVAGFSLAAMLWQIAHPPEGLEHDYRSEPGVPPDWSLDFEPALTRLLTATCIGTVEQKH